MREPAAPQTLPVAWTLAVLAHVFWGFLAPGGKVLLQWWPEWTLNAVRLALATLLVMAYYGREETRYGWKALLVDKNLVILGVVGIGGTFWMYMASLRYIEATAAAVLIFLAPFITTILARVFIGERSGWFLVAAAVLALVGSWLALFGWDAGILGRLDGPLAFGIGINLIAVFLWSVYTVHLRVVAPRYPLGRLTIASFIAATVFFGFNALVFDRSAWSSAMWTEPVSLLFLVLYVLFPSAGAYLLYAAAIERVGAGPITILLGLELLATSVLAHLILNERFPPVRIAGLVLTALAVVWFVWMQTRRAHPSHVPTPVG